MVVMLGEVLRQLEPAEFVVTGDPVDDTGILKVHEVTVRRASGELWQPPGDVGDAHRPPGGQKQLDQRSLAVGVALIGSSQAHTDKFVYFLSSGHPNP
jgi:hypothetical protein